MNVPFLNLKLSYDELAEDIEAAALRALRSGWYIGGEEVAEFEADFARYCGVTDAVAVANGLEALELALRAFNVGVGDEVIVPSNTFIATWLAVTRTGATIVPAEPNNDTYCIDADSVRHLITAKTRAIIPVHLYGQAADVDGIAEVVKGTDIAIIEDAAQAHGARYKTRRVGTTRFAAAWSFYPGKNLGALGDAGGITTSDTNVADRLRLLRNYGSKEKYVNEIAGFNSRMDPVQAAVLKVKLGVLDDWNARRCEIARRYMNAFRDTALILPLVPTWSQPVWHLFVIRHAKRDWLMDQLSQRGCRRKSTIQFHHTCKKPINISNMSLSPSQLRLNKREKC